MTVSLIAAQFLSGLTTAMFLFLIPHFYTTISVTHLIRMIKSVLV